MYFTIHVFCFQIWCLLADFIIKSDNICPYWQCWKWCDSLATIVAGNKQRTNRDHERQRRQQGQEKDFGPKGCKNNWSWEKEKKNKTLEQVNEISKKHFFSSQRNFVCSFHLSLKGKMIQLLWRLLIYRLECLCGLSKRRN